MDLVWDLQYSTRKMVNGGRTHKKGKASESKSRKNERRETPNGDCEVRASVDTILAFCDVIYTHNRHINSKSQNSFKVLRASSQCHNNFNNFQLTNDDNDEIQIAPSSLSSPTPTSHTHLQYQITGENKTKNKLRRC